MNTVNKYKSITDKYKAKRLSKIQNKNQKRLKQYAKYVESLKDK